MRVTYISSSVLPSRTANSIHVMKMCRAFATMGHAVVLISPDNKKKLEPNVADIYSFYGVARCFKIVKLPWINNRWQELLYGMLAGLYAKVIRSDIVYARNHVGAFCAAQLGINVIFEAHTPPSGDSGRLSSFCFNRLMKTARLKKIVVISQMLKDYYCSFLPQITTKVQVQPDAADPIPENVHPMPFPNKHKRLQVGYTGHLYKGRGVQLIIQLARECGWADFHLAGGTQADFERWQKNTDVAGNIFLYGFMPYLEAERFRLGCDVLIAPYQEQVSAENRGNIAEWMSPLKIFEYLAAGKAIICSDLPVIREVLHHGDNALLCRPDDVTVWIKSLTLLRHDSDLRKRLGIEAEKYFLKNYTWDLRAQKILHHVDLRY